MSASVTVRPGDSHSSPREISSKYRRCSVIGGLRISRAHAELLPDQRGAGGERPKLAPGDVAGKRHHPAVGARVEALGGTKGKTLRMVAATSSGVSIAAVATSTAPTSTSFPFRRPRSARGTRELAHSTET